MHQLCVSSPSRLLILIACTHVKDGVLSDEYALHLHSCMYSDLQARHLRVMTPQPKHIRLPVATLRLRAIQVAGAHPVHIQHIRL